MLKIPNSPFVSLAEAAGCVPPGTTERVASISDRRVENNVMRHEYRVLSDQEKEVMKKIKDAGLAIDNALTAMGSSRELSIAKTKNEEMVMWAVKHLTR